MKWRHPRQWDEQAQRAFEEAEKRLERRQTVGINMKQYAEGESRFLKTDDIKGHEVTVTISEITLEELDKRGGGKEVKPCIHFRGKEKGMICNVTNTKRLTEEFGEDSDSWIGKSVVLYTEDTELGPGLRVRVPKPTLSDDEVPF